MTKRLIEIDDDLLDRARAVSRATTIRETVETALRRMIGDNPAKRHLETMLALPPLDLDAIEEASRPRYPLSD